jgi:hypothetical protein
MTSAKSLDDIPGPKGVPVFGNMFEIKQATLIQDLMKLGRGGDRSSSSPPPPGRATSSTAWRWSTTSATTPASTSSSG